MGLEDQHVGGLWGYVDERISWVGVRVGVGRLGERVSAIYLSVITHCHVRASARAFLLHVATLTR